MRTYFQICVALALLASSSVAAEPSVKIAALGPFFGDFASQVGGDRVAVVDIVPPGVDPHDFEMTAGDLKKMAGSKLVVAGGLGFEPYLSKLRDSLTNTQIVELGTFVKPIHVEAGGHHHGHGHDHGHDHAHHDHADGKKIPDPHWWQSVPNVERAVKGLRDTLIEIDPEGKNAYKANAKAYLDQLSDLHRDIKVQVASIPRKQRVLVTSHEALNYLAKEYGFDVESVAGVTTTSEPSSREIQELIEKMNEDGVRAIFAENAENPKVLEQIAAETNAKLGGTLYVDTTEPGKADTYLEVMRHNIETVVSALR